MDILYPTASKIALFTGETVSISFPSGIPERLIPSVYTLPLDEILVGVEEPRVAVPPEIERLKSDTSRAPDPPLVLYTASLIVTEILVLLLSIEDDEIIGLTLRFVVLLLCEVEIAFPEALKIAPLAGVTVITSFPLTVPDKLIPKE